MDLLKKLFFDKLKLRPPKPGKSSLSVLVQSRNRSGVVDLVGREPSIIARVENGVTKFSPQRQKTPKFSKKKWIRKTIFSAGNFHFLAAGKLTFLGGGITSNWLASDHPGAYASMPHPFFGAKDVCYMKKGAGQIKTFSCWGGLVVTHRIFDFRFRGVIWPKKYSELLFWWTTPSSLR